MPTTFDYVIAIGEEEHVCRVTGRFYEGFAGRYYVDPQPPEEARFEVESVGVPIAVLQFGKPTGKFTYHDILPVLTDKQVEEIAELGVMAAHEDAIDALERRAEMRREDAFFDSMVEICRPDAAE
jgi:hypothetical protein